MSAHIPPRSSTVDSVQLSSSVTVGRYQALEAAGDRAELAHFIIERFDERYFWPVETSEKKHGFTILAVACLVIETLESFYQGRGDTRGLSRKMFQSFLARPGPLKVLGVGRKDWFFEDIRCGILHQAETRGGWLVARRGALLDTRTRTINSTKLIRELRGAVKAFAQAVQTDDTAWDLFKIKMAAVCKNCA